MRDQGTSRSKEGAPMAQYSIQPALHLGAGALLEYARERSAHLLLVWWPPSACVEMARVSGGLWRATDEFSRPGRRFHLVILHGHCEIRGELRCEAISLALGQCRLPCTSASPRTGVRGKAKRAGSERNTLLVWLPAYKLRGSSDSIPSFPPLIAHTSSSIRAALL